MRIGGGGVVVRSSHKPHYGNSATKALQWLDLDWGIMRASHRPGCVSSVAGGNIGLLVTLRPGRH